MSLKCKIGFHNWVGCKCTNCEKIRDERHEWKGCKCLKCDKTRDEQHDWSQDCEKCSVCSKIITNQHDWTKDCDKCSKCGKTRDEKHDWSKDCEKCSKCGKSRENQHDWKGCKCSKCGIENHLWEGHICVKCGNYKSVKIKTQEWMIENLNSSNFRNGEAIFEAKTIEEWIKAGNDKLPAWCYYNNNSDNGKKYGKLYNWYAIADKRGIAPVGWHVPTQMEFELLKSAVNNNGNSLKALGQGSEGGVGTNRSGFNVLLAGRLYNNAFGDLGTHTNFWSTTESSYTYAMNILLFFRDSSTYITDDKKESGFSIRCVRDRYE